MPELLDEGDADGADLPQGRIRVEIEQRLREASDAACAPSCCAPGISSAAAAVRGSIWSSPRRSTAGIVTYPGPIDLVHEWAYLPDLVAAMVRLAAVRERLAPTRPSDFRAMP